jgi:chemotaxis protein methyltransferase CheR
MLSARLQRRLRSLKLTTFAAYYRFLLKEDPSGDERRELINCVTTNKTSFFREPHHFTFLGDVFRRSFESPDPSRPFRVWSAACATGEEPYSIAMTLRDLADRSTVKRDFSILASDIDTQVLKFASTSIYQDDEMEPVSPPFRQRFFLRGRGSQVGRYRVKPELRAKVDFRPQNLIDPIWNVTPGFDAVFCRNALIYFEHQTQNQILRHMIACLKPGGYLIVGHSEQLHWLADVLELVATTNYRVKDCR